MQTVAPAASRHFTARILVDDDDLAFLDDVFHVFFVNAVGLQQLGGGVQARSRFVKLFGQFIFAAQFVFFRQAWIFVHFRKGGSQIRQHEIFRMAGGDDFPAFFHQVGVVGFFIHGEEHFLLQLVEFLLAGILVKGQFIFFHDAAQLGILHGAQEGAVAGLACLHLEQAAAHFFRAAFFLGFQGLGHQFVAKVRLGLHHALNGGAQGIVLLFPGDDRRAGNDEGGAGFVNKDGVHFVHNGEVVPALHLFGLGGCHAVVAQVVEAEFGVGAVSDVAGVLLPAELGGHHALDAADSQPQELEEHAHPFRVAARQIIVHGHHMHTHAGQGIQVNGEGGDKRFPFPRGHFRNVAAVQGNAAQQLHVKVDHVPNLFLTADIAFFPAEQAGAVFDGGEGLRQYLVQVAFAQLVKLGRNVVPGGFPFFNGGGSGFHRGEGSEFAFQGFKTGVQFGGYFLQLFPGRGFHNAHGGQIHGEEAMEVPLPFPRFLKQEFLSLAVP